MRRGQLLSQYGAHEAVDPSTEYLTWNSYAPHDMIGQTRFGAIVNQLAFYGLPMLGVIAGVYISKTQFKNQDNMKYILPAIGSLAGVAYMIFKEGQQRKAGIYNDNFTLKDTIIGVDLGKEHPTVGTRAVPLFVGTVT